LFDFFSCAADSDADEEGRYVSEASHTIRFLPEQLLFRPCHFIRAMFREARSECAESIMLCRADAPRLRV